MGHISATPERMDFLDQQGILWGSAVHQPLSEAHNLQETPLFAKLSNVTPSGEGNQSVASLRIVT